MNGAGEPASNLPNALTTTPVVSRSARPGPTPRSSPRSNPCAISLIWGSARTFSTRAVKRSRACGSVQKFSRSHHEEGAVGQTLEACYRASPDGAILGPPIRKIKHTPEQSGRVSVSEEWPIRTPRGWLPRGDETCRRPNGRGRSLERFPVGKAPGRLLGASPRTTGHFLVRAGLSEPDVSGGCGVDRLKYPKQFVRD